MARPKISEGDYPLNIQITDNFNDPDFAREYREYCTKKRYNLSMLTYKILRRFLDKKKEKSILKGGWDMTLTQFFIAIFGFLLYLIFFDTMCAIKKNTEKTQKNNEMILENNEMILEILKLIRKDVNNIEYIHLCKNNWVK